MPIAPREGEYPTPYTVEGKPMMACFPRLTSLDPFLNNSSSFPFCRFYDRWRDLSGGQQQSAGYVGFGDLNPKVLILIEPTGSIQPNMCNR